MNYTKYMGAFLTLALLAAPLCAVQAKPAPKKEPVSWQAAVKKENTRVNNRGAASVLGDDVGASVRRIALHAQEAKKLENFYTRLRKDKRVTESFIRQCRANYQALQQAAAKNPLFSHYALTALVPVDFCNLAPEDLAYAKRFFAGQAAAAEARQYKKAVLLRLENRSSVLWFVVNPQDKMLTFNYNDPIDIDTLDILQTAWTPLSVR